MILPHRIRPLRPRLAYHALQKWSIVIFRLFLTLFKLFIKSTFHSSGKRMADGLMLRVSPFRYTQHLVECQTRPGGEWATIMKRHNHCAWLKVGGQRSVETHRNECIYISVNTKRSIYPELKFFLIYFFIFFIFSTRTTCHILHILLHAPPFAEGFWYIVTQQLHSSYTAASHLHSPTSVSGFAHRAVHVPSRPLSV